MNDFRCTFLQPNFDTEVKKNEVIIVFYEESFKLCSEIDPKYVPRRVLGRTKAFRHTVKIISDRHNPYGMASNFLLGSQIRIRVEFRLLIKQ